MASADYKTCSCLSSYYWTEVGAKPNWLRTELLLLQNIMEKGVLLPRTVAKTVTQLWQSLTAVEDSLHTLEKPESSEHVRPAP